MADRIVSVGFLTEGDLEKLGNGFRRHFPIERDDMFADLMARLDEVPFDGNGRGAASRQRGL